MRLAVESKTKHTAFRPRTVELSRAGVQFWESDHHAKL
jgi:hypothetical protein